MRPYQWMYPFALIFLVLGGYGLKHSIIGGSFLIAFGAILYFYKWYLQYDAVHAPCDGSSK